ncbi:MAG: sugar ABC transporter ATP-binding protein, partial [Ruthenibacterium sp.]
IAKALSTDAKYLLLDEPTSSLTIHEAENLFMLLRKLKETGVTIIFVSHKLEEVLALCDCISVLRDGKFVATRSCENLQKHEIVQMMIGREAQDVYFGALEHQTDETMLEVKNLCQKGRFDNINFSLKKGEILGFYGLVGSGRTELAKIIIGEDRMTSGEIFVNGKLAHITSVADCLEKYKIGYVSENRKEDGLILDFSIKDNITITVWKRLAKWFTGFVNPKQIDAITEDMVDSMNIKTPTLNQLVRNLSGGNQQKVCIGKWLAANCDILIIDEPTVGVDVGAKQQIHDLIWNLANQEGKTILLISSDMTEMVALARRIFVFRESKLAGEVTNLDEYKGNYQEISKKIGQYLA